MDRFGQMYEKFRVHANELGDKIAELIHEGNVRRIIIKDERGNTFMEIPLTVATVGVILAPILAAVGAIATVVAKFEVVVERASPGGGARSQSGGCRRHRAARFERRVTVGWRRPRHHKPAGLAGSI
jgi:hypothetical protein